MPDQKLKLVAVGGPTGGPMVPDYEDQDVGRRSYVGRRLDLAQGVEFKDRDSGQPMRHAVFVPLEDEAAIVEKPVRAEYIRHLWAGDLLPGDQYTATQAGVPFDPAFKRCAAGNVGPKPAPTPPAKASK